jgi:tetratricopeptide (TPR) repeat protein
VPVTSPPLVRPWLLIVAGLIVAGAVPVAVLALKDKLPKLPRTAAEERNERARAAFLVAPMPVPTALPLLGPEGADSEGYPTRYVDRPGLRSLLMAGRFAELTSYVEQLQGAFEADPRKEYWPVDVGEAFGSAEPELAAPLDAWVAASPASFAPYFARGSYRIGRMWAMRGKKFADDTPQSDFAAMHVWAALAREDLDRSLGIRPKLVAAARQEMRAAAATADDARRDKLFAEAVRACSTCVQPRATYLRFRTPRWGGDYAAMAKLVALMPVNANPRLRPLRGYADFDQAELLASDDHYPEALAAIQRALGAGEYWEYLLKRSSIYLHLKRLDEAMADLDRADALRPMHPEILIERAYLEREHEKFLPAGRDLLTVLRIEPSNVDAKSNQAWVLNGVMVAAQRLDREGKREEALRAAELGLELGPLDGHVHAAYADIVIGDATTPERVAAVQRKAAESPGDFRAVQQLDYVLSRERRWAEILAAWNAYLGIHPNDGRAHMERSGTFWQLGRRQEAAADDARACELGINEGCVRAAGPK